MFCPRMADQIIDAEMARSLHVDACRAHSLVGWIIMRDLPDYPGKFVARLATNLPSAYLIVADTLAEVQAALPPNLVRKDRQSAHPPEVVEICFADP
jgi:hypothetical protein